MALDRGAQHLGIYLCCFDVLMSEHACHILDGHVMRQGEGGEGVARNVESEVLTNMKLHLNKMKVVIGFLITYMRQLIVVFF